MFGEGGSRDDETFQHKVAGDLAAADQVLNQHPGGLLKRLSLFIITGKPSCDVAQECDRSVKFLKEMHAWMLAGPMCRCEQAAFDGDTKRMYDWVDQTIDEFLAKPRSPPLKPHLEENSPTPPPTYSVCGT